MHCIASSAPSGGVHHIVSPPYNNGGTLWKRCQRLADHWNASRPLRCNTVHCGSSSAPCGGLHHILSPLTIMAVHYRHIRESLRTRETLTDHCGALQCKCVMHSARRKRHNSIHVPYHPAEQRYYSKEVQETAAEGTCLYPSLMQTPVFGRPYYRSSLWYSVSSVVCLSVCRLSVVCL